MSKFSGKNGNATWNDGGGAVDVPFVRNINVSKSPTIHESSDSDSAGETDRDMGTNDKTGSFTVYLDDTNDLPFEAGDKGTLVLTAKSGREEFNGGAIIMSIEPEIPIEGGGLVAANITFGQATVS